MTAPLVDLALVKRYVQGMRSTPDYTLRREPPPIVRRVSTRAKSPLMVNLEAAMAEPGERLCIGVYSAKSTASTVASDYRRGLRPVPAGSTHDQWEFESHKISDYEYGVWARFLG